MNIVIVLLVILATLAVIRFLIGHRCAHNWENIDDFLDRDGKTTLYVPHLVQRCSKCGTLRIQKIKRK